MATTMKIENLDIHISANRDALGALAAKNVSSLIKQRLNEQREVRVVFAAAPSQDEFLAELTSDTTIEWDRVAAYHMDEYLGLPPDSPALFSSYLNNHLFSRVRFKSVEILHSNAKDPTEECRRYARLLGEKPIDIVCMGIGENGHIAFNDPPVADFNDPETVKVVELDLACRQQQVNDGCFPDIGAVPRYAITLTVPTLFSAANLSIAVPGIRKAPAVERALYGEVSTACPASILRKHRRAMLFLEGQSASKIPTARNS